MAHSKKPRKKRPTAGQVPETQKNDLLEPIKGQSPTAVASEALRTGVSPYKIPNTPGIPGEMKLKGGDPDVDLLENEYSGEEFPGATTPTPDQSLVDAIGRAYGISEEDSGVLVTSEELMTRRDQRRLFDSHAEKKNKK